MTLQALVIDDEPAVRGFVAEVLQQDGWEVTEADSAEHAFEILHERDWSAVFCDVVMGGADGFSVLRRFKEELPGTRVVLMTGYGTAAGAMDASVLGAYDYLLKPFGVEAVQSLSRSISEELVSEPEVREIPHRVITTPSDLDINLVSRSETFIKLMQQVGRVATTDLPVLLMGETGTSKEVAASALHRRSLRADKPFVAVNCGAIPAESIEAELFGEGSGLIAGTHQARRGLWEQADGGTLFLNEIDETTPTFQMKVLRALEEGGIRPLGSTQTVSVDVRLVAASKLDIEEQVRSGKFRQDLFYRLNAVSIFLPPLRERREDISPLAHSFAERVNSRPAPILFSEEALNLLQSYPWPGNIRELENTIARAVALCDGRIRPQDLPERVRNYKEEHLPAKAGKEAKTRSTEVEELSSLAEMERKHVAKVLAHTKGNKQAAARLLEVDRKTLDRMIKRHKITLPRGIGTASRCITLAFSLAELFDYSQII
jgi:DNA-binding NtrC family response regulator